MRLSLPSSSKVEMKCHQVHFPSTRANLNLHCIIGSGKLRRTIQKRLQPASDLLSVEKKNANERNEYPSENIIDGGKETNEPDFCLTTTVVIPPGANDCIVFLISGKTTTSYRINATEIINQVNSINEFTHDLSLGKFCWKRSCPPNR